MTPAPHILIVEDEVELAEVLRDYLRAAGYQVSLQHDGLQAVDWVRTNAPAMLILDLMLPGKDGMDICREIRAFSDVPIMMATARVEEVDRLIGLELGADDYVCKPWSPREVVARVKAIMRRVTVPPAPAGAANDGAIVLDEHAYQASAKGNELNLTPVEFRLLKAFINQPGRVFSRGHLMDQVYTDQRVVGDRTVDTHVKNLRRKLHQHFPEGEVIRSIYGVGYKFEPPID